ncbi:DUF5106 domain-containing protein [Aureitalea sp. L0-47]|uniref:TlpA family protein disulfide reductase n=1 Tax=Aureitalea sp. L0-47 TaxID=2816962 RepID=UPI00223736C4|nr:thioredoxin-like domain-containing protein [Aureitalea sp. L0-47]MCW5518536.1 DUF5106 domain-containing protein [Aureitalea sp. L0-47]
MRTHFMSLCFLLVTLTGFSQTNTIRFHLEDPPGKEVLVVYYYGDKQYILGKEGSSPTAPRDENGNQLVLIDENGKGSFTHEGMKPGMYLMVFPPANNFIEFVFEGSDLDVYTKGNYILDHPGNSVSNRIKAQNDAFQKRRYQLQQEKPADLEQKMEALTNEYYSFLEEKRTAYPSNIYLGLLKAAENADVPEIEDKNKRFYAYRKNYFDKIDMTADWLVRTPIFNQKINEYFEKLTSKVPDSIIVAVDRIASMIEPNEELYKYFIIDRLNTYAKSKIMGHDKIYHHMAMNYYAKGKAPWTEQEQLNKILDNAKAMEGTLIGDSAFNFTAESTTGQKLSLHGIESKYTLLFLMDPFCGHCKDASNKIIELKDQLPSELRVLGVVFNASMEEMKRIKGERNYFWHCVVPSLDLQNDLRKAYNIKTYPMIYLLDSKKEIVAKQISVEQVLGIIDQLEQ